MQKKLLLSVFIVTILMTMAACTKSGVSKNAEENPSEKTSIVGIQLGDNREKVLEILGKEYKEILSEEAGHFPESYYVWDFEEGFTVIIGRHSEEVLQISAASTAAKTNLGIRIGDSAEKTLNLYRKKYTEPESIHGGELLGVFKVEDGRALIFDFNIADGIVNPVAEIKPDEKVERIILTYPAYIDDSF